MKRTSGFAGIAGAAVSVGLLVALADLSVETVIHRSPLAFVAVVSLAAYALFLVFTWRRADGIAQALVGLAAFGGVLIAATGGVSSVGFDADRLAATLLLSLSLVAVAGVVLLRGVPGALKMFATCLFAYACAPLVFSLVQRTGLSSALATNAPLPTGPIWMRGAYLATLALLPLSAAIALVLAAVAVSRKRFVTGQRALAAALAFAIATQMPEVQATDSGRIASGAAGAPAFGALFVPEGSDDVPPEVAAVAASVAQDPQHALEAVDGLGDDIYPGALGGSVGALRSGSANSVDKALLLRDLVRAGSPSIETAFAQCTLPDTEADALVAQARGVRSHPKIMLQNAEPAAGGATDPAARAMLQRWADSWRGLVRETQDEGGKLSGELQSAGLVLPPGSPASDRLRALAARHVWLRARVDGTWVDLDPTIEPAAPGRTRCTAQVQTAKLPDDLFDVLDVRVAVETLVGNVPARTVAFDRSMRTVDVGDRSVSFMFAEPSGMSAAPDWPASQQNAPLAFTPLLRVGGENLTGTPFSLPAPTQQDFGNAVNRGVGAAISVLGGHDDTPSPSAAIAPVDGAWMELSVSAPASDTTFVQSPIFDRIGYAVRSAHSPFPVLAAEPDAGTYRALQTVWNVAVSGGHAASGGGAADISGGSDVPALGDALARLNTAYFAVRRALVDDALGTNVGIFTAQPGISLLAFKNNGNLAFDIASDGAVPLATQEVRPTWAAAAVLAERAVVHSEALLAVGDLGVRTSDDALVAFDQASASGTRFLALRPTAPAPSQSVVISADARARMSQHLAAGAAVLAPAPTVAQIGGPAYAYWILDPAAGTLRDENEFGRHSAGVEETETNKEVAFRSICRFSSLANKVATVARMAVLAMGIATLGAQGGSAPAQLAKAVAKTVQAQAESDAKRRKMLLNCK